MDGHLLFHNRLTKNSGDVSLDSSGNLSPMLSSELRLLPGEILHLL